MDTNSVEMDLERVLCELGFDGTEGAKSIVGTSGGEVPPSYALSPAYVLGLAAPGLDGKLWDFSDEAYRKKCEMAIETQKPMLVFGGAQPGSALEGADGQGSIDSSTALKVPLGDLRVPV